jgi:hypothetical protein
MKWNTGLLFQRLKRAAIVCDGFVTVVPSKPKPTLELSEQWRLVK